MTKQKLKLLVRIKCNVTFMAIVDVKLTFLKIKYQFN